MSPRPYRGEHRRAAAEETRTRIVRAAQELLAGEGSPEFSIDTLAKRAGVARMTVYYQFGSKRGLLEAIFDALAAGSLAADLPAAYSEREPIDALNRLIRAFLRFWASERLAIRRLRALAVLDPEVAESLRARDERRREGLRGIIKRLAETERPPASSLEDTVDILHTLTSFETYDALAGEKRGTADVEQMVRDLASGVLESAGERAGRG